MQSNTYPQQSYNNAAQCEQRWNDDVRSNLNDDGWQISIKNGKRLNRRWTKAQGFYIIDTPRGERSIYNERYDAELNRAKAEQYNMAFQPDGEFDFYTTQQHY
tara:strand:- start:6955 stop:7263 length:309 start_codon:yes stop_codon:yes gene_type:complete